MDREEQIQVWLTQYVKGDLSGQELIEFEKILAEDPQVQEDLELELATFELMLDADALTLKDMMRSDLTASNYQVKSNKWKWVFGLGVLLLAGSLFFMGREEEKPEIEVDTLAASTIEITDTMVQVDNHGNNDEEVFKEVKPSESGNSRHSQNEIKSKDAPSVIDSTMSSPELATEPLNYKASPSVKNKVYNDTLEKETIVTAGIDPLKLKKTSLDQVQAVKVDSCDILKFKGELKAKASQLNSNNGVIYLNDALVTGGKRPFEYSLDGEYFESSFQFENLSIGQYKIFVKDANGCITENIEPVTIGKTYCIEDYSPTFNMAYESSWELPVVNGESVKLKLVSKVGQILVNRDFQIYNSGDWDGRDDNGSLLTVGSYNWIIEYKSGEICNAKMTILN